MLLFWQECKYILRSRFLWIVAVIGVLACAFFSSSSWNYDKDSYAVTHGYVQENGFSFTEKDVEEYHKSYLDHMEDGEKLREVAREYGLEDIEFKDIVAYWNGEPSKLDQKLNNLEEADDDTQWNVLSYLDVFKAPHDLVSSHNLNPKGIVENAKNELDSRPVPLSEWKKEMLLDGFRSLQERAESIVATKENQYLLPLAMDSSLNSLWFESQFNSYGLGFLWAIAFVLAGIIVARSLGGSMMNNMQGMVYTGKPGRKFVLYKILSSLAISALAYLAMTLVVTLGFIIFFRLDLYWNIPLSAISGWRGSTIPRFFVTIGGYWWFQLGVGLGAVLIMALIFSAAMMLTKSFYAGSAISVGVALFLWAIVDMIPSMKNSLLLMGSPLALFMNTGKFLQQSFLFSVLPHFEGYALLAWGGIAAVLGILGFVRFRRTSL